MTDLAFNQYRCSKPVGALKIQSIKHSVGSDTYILSLECGQTFEVKKHNAIYIEIEFNTASEIVGGYLIANSNDEQYYEYMTAEEFAQWHEAIN